MAKQKNKAAGENEALIALAKEFLRYFPTETTGYILEDGTPFLNREKTIAVKEAEANNKRLFEFDSTGDLLTEIEIKKA